MNLRMLAAAGGVCLLTACRGGGDVRQEVIGKLRALGVATNPVVSAWSQDALMNEVEFTVYAALPITQAAVTIEAWRDPRQLAPLTYAADQIVLDQSTLKITPTGGLNLVEIKAKASVPTEAQAEAAHALKPGSTGAQINYGFKIDAGSEEELVTGTYMAYTTGSPELSLATPTVSILDPLPGVALPVKGKEALKATVDNVNDEDIKLGWFVTGGEVQNRRAKETVWTRPDGAGPQTVILTVRGKKSRAFSMQVVPLTTQ